MNTRNLFWTFLLLMTLLRLRVATQFGLTVDEAHYVLYAKHLDWSYFDHPPMVGWVHWLFQLIPIDHLLKARLPPISISLWTSILIFRYLKSKGSSEAHAALAVTALNLTPMYNAMSVAFLPDTLLMPLTVLIIDRTEKLLAASTLKNWLILGTLLGLAGLSKYTAILYVAALVLIFISEKRVRELLRPQLWAGVAVALALVSPVLYWNLKHHFASFQYQADHVLSLDTQILKNLGGSFVLQAVSWGIGPFLIALFTFPALRNKNRIPFIFLSVFLVFFIYASIAEVLLPHWMLMYFLLAVPFAYLFLLESGRHKKIALGACAFSALLSFVLLFELGFHIFPIQKTASAYEGISGWDDVMDKANEHLRRLTAQNKAIAVMNWTLGSRAMYYNREPSTVFVVDRRQDQFDIWAPLPQSGYDLLAVIEAEKKEEHLAHLNCAQLTSVGEHTSFIKDVPVNHFLYYHCAEFSGYK